MGHVDRNRPLPRNGEELFPDCKRCGIRISNLSVDHWCGDCRTIENGAVVYAPVSQQRYPVLPYTVTVHVPDHSWLQHPTYQMLRDLEVRHTTLYMEDDWVAHQYVTDTLGHYQWPVVTVTDVTDLLTHWEGHQPKQLKAWAPATLEVAA